MFGSLRFEFSSEFSSGPEPIAVPESEKPRKPLGFRGSSSVGARGFEASRPRRALSRSAMNCGAFDGTRGRFVTVRDVGRRVWLRRVGGGDTLGAEGAYVA